MKTISVDEAQVGIVEIISRFRELAKIYPTQKMSAKIENIGLTDLFILFSRIQTNNKRIFMPNESGLKGISIVYVLCPGVSITIESEPCLKFKPKINTINYN